MQIYRGLGLLQKKGLRGLSTFARHEEYLHVHRLHYIEARKAMSVRMQKFRDNVNHPLVTLCNSLQEV